MVVLGDDVDSPLLYNKIPSVINYSH